MEIESSYTSVAEDCEDRVPLDWFYGIYEGDYGAYDDVGILYEWIESHYKKQGWDGVHDEPDSSSDSD